MDARGRRQGALGALTLVPAVAAALVVLAGCDAAQDPDYVAVCSDRAGNRVDDAKCDRAPTGYAHDSFDGSDAFLWYYIGTQMGQTTAPAVGQRVTGGYYRTPATVGGGSQVGVGQTVKSPTIARGGSVPSSGGKVGDIARGGLGVKGGSLGSAGTKGGGSVGSGGSAGS